MKPVRLLAIIEAYSITGPARNLLEFARLGRQVGVETVIGTFRRSGEDNLFIRTARAQGVQVEPLLERGAWDSSIPGELRDLAARVKPGVIQTHAVKSHFLTRRAALDEALPWVAFHHGYTWPTLKARLYNQFDRWSLRAASQVLTVSAPFREELVERGVPRERIIVIHNAIADGWGLTGRQPEAGAATRGRFGIPADRKVVLIVGRLSREKDHLTLLDAVAKLPAGANAHLVIVGEGPERPRIEERIARLKIADRVTLTGQVDSAEPLYGVASVAVLSSLSEGSPNALLEAMSAHVPVVATPVGGIPEIVTHGESARLVNPGDVPAMAEAMEMLLADAAVAARQVERAAAVIRERHSPLSRVERLAEIYRRLATRLPA
jgi:glycosyltransferase involved in cell wall biosynthesis